MFFPRLITAIIGIPLVIGSVYWGSIPFFVFLLGIVILALQEYYMLAKTSGYDCRPVLGTVMGTLLFVMLFLSGTVVVAPVLHNATAAFMSFMLMPLLLLEIIRPTHEKASERLGITFLGAFFIPWALGHLALIRSFRPLGMEYVLFLFLTIWFLDTGAYAIGIKYGRLKLAPSVSPKKTIEGAIGGTIIGIITALVLRVLLLRSALTISETIGITAVLSVVAQFSDLSESLFKREAGVKDSADLLPGHGGMFDRFDSFLFTAPLLYYYLSIFKGM